MKKISVILSLVFMFFSVIIFAQPEVELPHATPGSCYVKCLMPNEYRTETDEVLVKAASSKVEIIAAEFETVTEQVLVKEASSRIERVPAEYETQTQSFVKGCPSGYAPEGGSLVAGGNCVRSIPVPAEYETVIEQVLVKEASTRLEIIPPTYENLSEQILIKAAYTPVQRPYPAQYETATEQVLVSEASTRIERKPARYKSESEQIEIAPAATKWVKKKTDINCSSANPNDCVIWCLVETPAKYQTIIKKIQMDCEEGWTAKNGDCIRVVEIPAEYSTRTVRVLKTGHRGHPREIPAEYKTISKRVVKTPAQIQTIKIPAEYKAHTIRKLKTPATTRIETVPVIMDSHTAQVRIGCPAGYIGDIGASGKGDCIRTIEIPAEYTNRFFQKLVTPASVKIIPVPAEYKTVDRQVLVKKGGFTEWREMICHPSHPTIIIRKIQEVLISRGYDPGPANNKMSNKTKAALIKYQKDHNLPVGNLDRKTMKSLGVNF